MIRVLLCLFELPDCCLFPTGEPFVLTAFLPAIEHRFVLPLVRAATKNKRRLLPYATAREIEPSLLECTAEVESFGICMEDIDRCIVSHDSMHIGECIEKELMELGILKAVVLYLTSLPFIVDIVWRVGNSKVCLVAVHELVDILSLSGVPYKESVLTENP